MPDPILALQLSSSLRTRVMPRTLFASWTEVGKTYQCASYILCWGHPKIALTSRHCTV